MYRLVIEDHFDAAHCLRGYKGPCARIHGHTWKVEVCLEGKELDKVGILVDFKIIKQVLKKILDEFDHRLINKEVVYFKKVNPTAENLSKYVYEKLNLLFPAMLEPGIRWVRVWESPVAYCEYEN